ncbi:Uu.00g011720.m01.CDS01 [Anthostomella pinea]|uniref:Uu.00g011720.m01.CDS01 n=1 Tax=Anthostomella pinea TaxID=933095 RepID=A0AAI8YQ38_9PEZI|nr:Uu.00g011720.m01.CDS01 [Anthostomella pinea]
MHLSKALMGLVSFLSLASGAVMGPTVLPRGSLKVEDWSKEMNTAKAYTTLWLAKEFDEQIKNEVYPNKSDGTYDRKRYDKVRQELIRKIEDYHRKSNLPPAFSKCQKWHDDGGIPAVSEDAGQYASEEYTQDNDEADEADDERYFDYENYYGNTG